MESDSRASSTLCSRDWQMTRLRIGLTHRAKGVHRSRRACATMCRYLHPSLARNELFVGESVSIALFGW